MVHQGYFVAQLAQHNSPDPPNWVIGCQLLTIAQADI